MSTTDIKAQTILTLSNTKIVKGMAHGYITAGIHFAPGSLSGKQVCPFASPGCLAGCLNLSGRGKFTSVQRSRIAKTQRLMNPKTRGAFMAQLVTELRAFIRKAARRGLTPCIRLNLTSDIPWENVRHDGQTVFELFPSVQFYDYTKNPNRMAKALVGKLPANYHLTFSRSETNDLLARAILKSGGNVAVVFRGALPTTWHGFPVNPGDESDLRFLDSPGVVGLTAKGKAKKDESGFVV